ncbi:MAG: flagellar protein FlaG [Candidatus Hydrogenedentes bacterium]|nr:flagellar protein FlaG [Candidatus Hydrogenedentota bacterium]
MDIKGFSIAKPASTAPSPVAKLREVSEEPLSGASLSDAAPKREARASPEPSSRDSRRVIETADIAPITKGGIRIGVDEPTDRYVFYILDENREVLKQIPPEELLRITSRIQEIRGLIFDESV